MQISANTPLRRLRSNRHPLILPWLFALFFTLPWFSNCSCQSEQPKPEKQKTKATDASKHAIDSRPPPMAQPVPLWEKGKIAREIDAATARDEGYVVLDLGDDWTPYIFTERGNQSEEVVENDYRTTYLALAQGKYPKNHHGERARRDKYLELYGIAPTLNVLRQRLKDTQERACLKELNNQPLEQFDGFIVYRGNDQAKRLASRTIVLGRTLEELTKKHRVASIDQLTPDMLSKKEEARLREYKKIAPNSDIVRVVQARLKCEGYLEGKGKYIKGGLDWATHEALAEFERRNRIYAWGYIGQQTLKALRKPAMQLDHEAVIRVLNERAIHAAGIIEDGSTSHLGKGKKRTFKGADGKNKEIPNLEAQLKQNLIDAFGLQNPESTLKWLSKLGSLEGSHLVALKMPALPEYYDGDMNLSVVINRGDVWYEFPYDSEGKARNQPVQRRPKVTIYTEYLGQKIPIARYGTTIGGWRSEVVDGRVMWKYKNSPTGPRVWHQVVAAPVWLPPESTPHRELLSRVPGGKGKERFRVNYHETGPSYASAYGLVAAYHMKFTKRGDDIRYGGDEGIRTHGSVDYMSIMRRHSHGCHRLHNHIAVRLMSFVLAHRPHTRQGQQQVALQRQLIHEDYSYTMAIKHGGYVFDLERPIEVNVVSGRIRGRRKVPIAHAIPKFNSDLGYYINEQGMPVSVDAIGAIRPLPVPVDDNGKPLFPVAIENGKVKVDADGNPVLATPETANGENPEAQGAEVDPTKGNTPANPDGLDTAGQETQTPAAVPAAKNETNTPTTPALKPKTETDAPSAATP